METNLSRVFWRCIVVAGVIFTCVNIHRCSRKYYSFPVSTDVSLGDASNLSDSFPTVTFCLNSMHSASKVKAYHPHAEFLSSLGLIYGYYYDSHGSLLDDVIDEIKNHIGMYDVSSMMKETYQPFKLVACSFLNQPCGSHIEYG